jgi:hypothetical protein
MVDFAEAEKIYFRVVVDDLRDWWWGNCEGRPRISLIYTNFFVIFDFIGLRRKHYGKH